MAIKHAPKIVDEPGSDPLRRRAECPCGWVSVWLAEDGNPGWEFLEAERDEHRK